MSGSEDDEDFRLAITLSLRDSKNTESGNVINLDSDDEATASAGQATSSRVNVGSGGKSKDVVEIQSDLPALSSATANSNAATITSMPGLNRKAMEEERLARKRKASISPPPPRKALKPADPEPKAQGIKLQEQYCLIPSQELEKTGAGTRMKTTSLVGPEFLQGAVKKTWAFGHSRNGSDIKIQEVLQPQTLTLAVLSSFQWEVDWLLQKLDTRKTQIVFVMQAKDDSTKEQYRRETAAMPNLRLCYPSMAGGVNCMHSKLMLLAHPSHLRIVVPTANLVSYDWGETGVMENSLFLVDLPRLPEGRKTSNEDMLPFGHDLVYFLRAMGLEASIIESINNFDFSTTKPYAFVHTIGGVHEGETWRNTGYCGFGRAVQNLELQTSSDLKIDFVASSIGSLNFGFLSALYLAIQGDDGLTECGRRYALQNKSKAGFNARRKAQREQEDLEKILQKDFRIYFPSHDTVVNSIGGTNCGGTNCFQSKWYKSPTFPSELMRDSESVRKGLLMHNKILFVRPQSSPSSSSKPYAYIGSANCSESAWGRLTQDRQTKAPKLSCRNWECGVIVPLRGEIGDGEGLEMFEGTVPVPMEFPGREYGSRKPWFCYEQ